MRVIYGINPVKETLKLKGAILEKIFVSSKRSDRLIHEIIKEAGTKNIVVKIVEPREITTLAGTDAHQGVAAFIKGEYHYATLDSAVDEWRRSSEKAFFLILDSILDPQNMGSLIRSSHAAGAHAVIIPKDRSCPVTPSVVKASSGATEHTLVARVTNLRDAIARLKEEGVWVVGVEADSPKNIYREDLNIDLALVIGSEGKGIRRLVRESCDFCVHIPMRGEVSSLNASAAGALALFEARRQRDTAR